MTSRRAVVLAAPALAAGCQSFLVPTQANVTIEQILNQIKYEVALYRSEDRPPSGPPPQTPSDRCPGDIHLDIRSVKVKLNAQTAHAAEGSAAAGLTLGPASIGPSWSASGSRTDTSTLTFTLYVRDSDHMDPSHFPEHTAWDGTPIRDVLRSLRGSLERVVHRPPCLGFEKPGGGQENSFEFGFTVVTSQKAGVTFKFLVFSLGATQSDTRTTQNTITIGFGGTGSAFTAS